MVYLVNYSVPKEANQMLMRGSQEGHGQRDISRSQATSAERLTESNSETYSSDILPSWLAAIDCLIWICMISV